MEIEVKSSIGEAKHTKHQEEDKENKDQRNNQRPSYLMFEDFSHEGQGLETYSDGLTHPVELRRILTGDLSCEMSVGYKDKDEENFRSLVYPQNVSKGTKRGVEIFDSTGRSVFNTFPTSSTPSSSSPSSILPRPPKLYKGGANNPFGYQESSEIAVVEPESDYQNGSDMMGHLMLQHSAFSGGLTSPRKPGRPPTAQGAFDPETGSIRYLCRLQCGASLASAKGRRKHEKKHCPNFGKMAQPTIRGGGRQNNQEQLMLMTDHGGYSGHSLFGGGGGVSPIVERKTYECRYCGKVLKTYEGRRLHEKLQHVVKMGNLEMANNFEAFVETEDVDTEDSKQLLIEHLKAAGLDPDILNDDEVDKNDLNESYDNEEDEDEDEENDKLAIQYNKNNSNQNNYMNEPIIEYTNVEDEDGV